LIERVETTDEWKVEVVYDNPNTNKKKKRNRRRRRRMRRLEMFSDGMTAR